MVAFRCRNLSFRWTKHSTKRAVDRRQSGRTGEGKQRIGCIASEASEGFARHYFDALQRDPDVVFAHADAAKLFNPKKSAA